MTAPLCDNHPEHGPMKHVIITQGDRILGCFWSCVHDDENKPDYCDGCADCDCTDEQKAKQAEQLSMFGG